jgi:CHAT domain-containing protein
LIHRNPVIYIHSLSLLRSSLSAAEHARYSPPKANPQFLAGISQADATAVVNGRRSNYTAGRNSIKKLAELCKTPPRIDESGSKLDFITAMTQSRLLHLHTHCNWQFSDPLDHHVEFPNIHGAGREDKGPDLKLTAKEIFAIRLGAGTHVNMIACQGGLMEVKMGDEVMGLVPALLYSGATSTVSTLWSIADPDGARFSKLFFQSFFDQCKEHSEAEPKSLEGVSDAQSDELQTKGTSFVDIAAAVQEAVIDMDPNGHESLYSWAAFVLHGFWMFSLSLEDVKRFAQASLD